MQLDMHYYGTYAIARAAGLSASTAKTIATASQFVDDSDVLSETLADGGFVHHAATAHHPSDLAPNVDAADQRKVWVPFHFLPGNEGNSLEERLVCRQDSKIARAMLAHALSHAKEPYGAELLGVAAHVYADTFSHYGFSGVTSDLNRVAPTSIKYTIKDPGIQNYVASKLKSFLAGLAAQPVNMLGLGHGSVATCPDRPYLVWSFKYASGKESGTRDNPASFLVACEQLFNAFIEFAQKVPDVTDATSIKFADIRETIKGILALEGTLDDRVHAWKKAMSSGELTNQKGETIPQYESTYFMEEADCLKARTTCETEQSVAFQFMRAAQIHRNYVLNDLLPGNGLIVMLP